MFRKFILVSTISLFMLAGCASILQIFGEKPKAELKEVVLKDASFSGGTLVFVVNIYNPNSFNIDVREINYKVFISGQEFSTAKTSKAFSVPAKKDLDIEIPLPVKFGSLWTHLSQALVSKALVYKIEGNAKLSFTTIPFSKDGKLELQ